MRTVARLTAIIFVVVGLVAVIWGAILFTGGGAPPDSRPVEPGVFGQLFGGPDLSAFLLPLRWMVAGSVALQGLMLVGAGQVLWLVANIARKNEQSAQHLATLAARGSMTIP